MQNETNQAYKIRSLVLYRVGKRAIFVFSRVRFERFSDTPLRILAFHASVFRGARISSLPTNGRNIRAPLKTPAQEVIQTPTQYRHLYMMDSFVCPDEKLICFV